MYGGEENGIVVFGVFSKKKKIKKIFFRKCLTGLVFGVKSPLEKDGIEGETPVFRPMPPSFLLYIYIYERGVG